MEYVEGETLAQVLGRLNDAEEGAESVFGDKDRAGYFEKIGKAFADVADGLQHAHSKGVIHRDIKPSNLILDSEDRLRILDFGLARLEGQESLTLSGDFVGTPAYMSPEQAKRRKIPVDHRTDIYSLGATVYELLTHQQPFRGKDHNDTLSQIVERDPRPPRQLNPRVPRDLETMVTKCLRKDAGDRYGTAEALAQDLRRFVRGDAIEARPEGEWDRWRRRLWHNRVRLGIGVGALLLALAVGLLALAFVEQRAARRAIAYEDGVLRAVQNFHLSRFIGGVAPGSVNHQKKWSDLLGRLRLVAESGAADELRMVVEDLRATAALLPDRPDAYYHEGRALVLLNRPRDALVALAKALEAEASFLPARALRATLYRRLGEPVRAEEERQAAASSPGAGWAHQWFAAYTAVGDGAWEDAEAAYNELLLQLDPGRPPFLGASLEIYLGRGMARLESERFAEAERDFNAANTLWPNALAPALLLGQAYMNAERVADSQEWFREFLARTPAGDQRDRAALEIAAAFLSTERRTHAREWIDAMSDGLTRDRARLVVLTFNAEFNEALEFAEETYRRYEEVDPITDAMFALLLATQVTDRGRAERKLEEALDRAPGDPTVVYLAGAGYHLMGNFSRSTEIMQKARDLDPDFNFPCSDLGAGFMYLGRYEDAISVLSECLRHDPSAVLMRAQLGHAYGKQGLYEEAKTQLDEAIRRAPHYSLVLSHYGKLQEEQGLYEAAEATYHKALQVPTPDSLSLLRLAYLLARQGKFDEALQHYCTLLPDESWRSELRSGLRGLRDLLCPPRKPRDLSCLDSLLEFLTTFAESDDAPIVALEALALTLLHAPERRDVQRALELAEEVVARRGHPGAKTLSILAVAEWKNGLHGQAIRTLEEAVEQPGATHDQLEQLRTYRSEYAPAIASLTSLDALLEIEPSSTVLRQVESLGTQELGVELALLKTYAEARVLQLAGAHREAAAILEGLVAAHPQRALLLHRFAEGLRASGQATAAEKCVLDGLTSSGFQDAKLVQLWLRLASEDLGRDASELLTALPTAEDAPQRPDRLADFRWLLRGVARGSVRINCGGRKDIETSDGEWGKDRFFLGGSRFHEGSDALETAADPLYKTQRQFSETSLALGYAIPLPSAAYRVTLHFAEVQYRAPGMRTYDVTVEDQTVLKSFDPLAAGFGRAMVESHEVEVEDGLLEIHFDQRKNRPMISTIEIDVLR